MKSLEEPQRADLLNSDQLKMLKDLEPDDPKSLINDLVDAFLQDWPKNKAEVERVCSAGDRQGLRAIAHLLAGSASNIGLNRFSLICRAIENAADAGETLDFPGCQQKIFSEQIAGIEAIVAYIKSL